MLLDIGNHIQTILKKLRFFSRFDHPTQSPPVRAGAIKDRSTLRGIKNMEELEAVPPKEEAGQMQPITKKHLTIDPDQIPTPRMDILDDSIPQLRTQKEQDSDVQPSRHAATLQKPPDDRSTMSQKMGERKIYN